MSQLNSIWTAVRNEWTAFHLVWTAVSVAAIAMVAMIEVGTTLTQIEQPGQPIHGPDAFTGPVTNPTDTGELFEALALWGTHAEGADWVFAHTGADAVFIFAYGYLLYRVLRAVLRGDGDTFAQHFAWAIVGVDLLETGLTALLVGTAGSGLASPHEALAVTVQGLTMLKWTILIAVLLIVVVNWALPRVAASLTAEVAAQTPADTGLPPPSPATTPIEPQPPEVALRPLVGLAIAFAAVVALPAQGAMEQLPDVIRGQLGRLPIALLGPTAALLLLVVTVTLAAWKVTDPATARPEAGPVRTRNVVIGLGLHLLVVGGLYLGAQLVGSDTGWTLGFLAPSVVLLALVILLVVRQISREDIEGDVAWQAELYAGPNRLHRLASRDFRLFREVFHRVRDPKEPPDAGKPRTSPPAAGEPTPSPPAADEATATPPDVTSRRRLVQSLAAAFTLAGMLGLLRAVFRPWLINDLITDSWPAPVLWVVAFSVLAPLVAIYVVGWWADRADGFAAWQPDALLWRSGTLFRITATVAVLGFGVTAAFPEWAWVLGTNGTVALGAAAMASVMAALVDQSRRRRPWKLTRDLKLGSRTPWLTLLLVTWLVAGALDTVGGYHDVHAPDQAAASPYQHDDLQSAFRAWIREAPDENCDEVPLIVVAAPGGGIRAAYWTAGVLDTLDEYTSCGRPAVFAVSGVSGGSVGATTWLASQPADDAVANVGTMAQDKGLAAAAAALLGRDPLQPLIGATGLWGDRARVLEAAWARDVDDLDQPWSSLGDGGFTPVLVLNGSSATDGCRVLISNTKGLPFSRRGCLGVGAGAPGPASAAQDLFQATRTYERGSAAAAATTHEGCPQPLTDLRASTAALLSARFPVVSPSGVVRGCEVLDPACPTDSDGGGCPTRIRATHVVDGGYYENSGLLTALDLVDALQPLIEGYEAERIVPWIVMADSAARSQATTAPPARPRELLLPLQTRAASELLSTAALEQRARHELAVARPRSPSQPVAADGPTSHFVRLGPRIEPSVAAPLGWVLSDASMRLLDTNLEIEFSTEDEACKADEGWCDLREVLRPPPDP